MKVSEHSCRSASGPAGRAVSHVDWLMSYFRLASTIFITLAMMLSCGPDTSRSIERSGAESVRVEVDVDLEPKTGVICLDDVKFEQTSVRARAGQLSDGTEGIRFLFLEPGWGPHDVSVFLCNQPISGGSGPDVVVEVGRCVAFPARAARQLGNRRRATDGMTTEILPGGGAVGIFRLNRLPKRDGSEFVVQFDIQLDPGLSTVRSIRGDARFTNAVNGDGPEAESSHPNPSGSTR